MTLRITGKIAEISQNCTTVQHARPITTRQGRPVPLAVGT